MGNTYLARFKKELDFLRRSDGTTYRYIKVGERYLEYTKNKPQFVREEIIDFLNSFGGISATYASWVIRVLHRFYTSNGKDWPLIKGEAPSVEVKPQPYVTPDEVGKLLELAKNKNKRDYALMQVLIDTGCRRDEIVKLNIDNYHDNTLLINLSKREGVRTVRLNDETIQALNNYLKERRDKNDALFLNNSARDRISANGVTNMAKGYFKLIRTDERGKGAHSFRRGVVTALANQGVSQLKIQAWGGWRSSEMVSRYCQLTSDDLSEEIAEAKALRSK